MIHSLAVCSVTLIAIAQNDDADDCHYSNLLNLVFNAMVLLVGIEEVINMKNVEKFKKEIKVGAGVLFFSSCLIYQLHFVNYQAFNFCKQNCNGTIQEMLDYIDFKTILSIKLNYFYIHVPGN